jgi:hypothetical protein
VRLKSPTDRITKSDADLVAEFFEREAKVARRNERIAAVVVLAALMVGYLWLHSCAGWVAQ